MADDPSTVSRETSPGRTTASGGRGGNPTGADESTSSSTSGGVAAHPRSSRGVTDTRLVDGDAADGAPLDGVCIDGVCIDGGPVSSAPVNSAPVNSAPIDDELVENVLDDGTSLGGATVGRALRSETPTGDTSATRASVDHAPLDGAPIDIAPSDTAPAHKTLAHSAPTDSEPLDDPPLDDPSLDGASLDSALSATAPADKTPADSAPADSAPTDSAPARKTPTDSATLKSPPVDSRPMDSPVVGTAARRLAPEAANGLELEPAGAAQVFGDRLALARQFAVDLATHGEPLGLIGPLEVGRLWSRHIINCGVVAPFLFANARVADVGSGAGLPGLVLAIARPDVSMTLIEPMERRTDWLHDEVARLGLNNVTVLRARAEDARDAGPFDQVTARAVSALAKLIPLTAALLRPGGELILLKGSRVADEIEAAAAVLRRHRVSNIEVRELGQGIVPEVTRLFRATVGGAS